MIDDPSFYDSLASLQDGVMHEFKVSDRYDVSISVVTAGAKIPEHTHDVDVFNYGMEGEFEVIRSGKAVTHTRGDWIHLRAHETHAVVAKTTVRLLELWAKY